MGTWRWFMISQGCLLLWWYPTIFFFSIISFLSFQLFLHINRNLVTPLQWPFLGMLPGLAANADRTYDFVTGVLRNEPECTFMFKGPRLVDLDFIITCNPANGKHMYSTHFSDYPKGDDFMKIFDILGRGIFTSNGERWSKHRKMSHNLLTSKDFRNSLAKCSQDKIEKAVLPLLERISRLGRTIDLQDLIKRFTTDVMSTLVLGKDLGCLAPDLPHVPFAGALEDAEHVLLYRHTVPIAWWKLLRWLGVGKEKMLSNAVNVIEEFVARRIEDKRREAPEEAPKDLLTWYMYSPSREDKEDTEHGDYFSSDSFLRDTLITLMAGGTDTTTGALSWFFYLVCKNPAVERKILEELRQHKVQLDLEEDGMFFFDVEETKNLVYLHAALYESLRLYPAVPFNHKTALKEDVLPSGHRVRPGTMILFCTYSSGRMEKYWGEDCLEFKPERWISSDGQFKHVQSHDSLIFHCGPRSCIGKNVALTQMKVLAAAIIYNFHVEAVEGCAVHPRPSIVLQIENGLRVKMRKRECAAIAG